MATKSSKNIKKIIKKLPKIYKVAKGTEMEVEVFDEQGKSLAKVKKSSILNNRRE